MSAQDALRREVETLEVTVASLSGTIEQLEEQLGDVRSRKKVAVLELTRAKSALLSLEGRTRTRRTTPAPPPEPVEVETIDITETVVEESSEPTLIDESALAEIEARNEEEQRSERRSRRNRHA